MASCTLQESTQDTNVGMGRIMAAGEPTRLRAVLGSCIGVALYSARRRAGAFAHVVLPESNGQNDSPGKFADTAVPHMVHLMLQEGANAGALVAKIVGGACMFGNNGPLQIGPSNAQAVETALSVAGVRMVARDVGGNKGRRVLFDPHTGNLTTETAGGPAKTL